ncbi:MAG: hypothetical protein QXU20_03870 [Candidatus Woesearchaeota archaeon]
MSKNKITIFKEGNLNALEDLVGEKIFSDYTHPKLEEFIQNFINKNKEGLPTEWHQKLVREFLLYGFMKASDEEFISLEREIFKVEKLKDKKYFCKFYTNNGVLAISDQNGNVYIRGGDSYHGWFPGDPFPEGVEGTLINFGYERDYIFVPHSNGDVFKNEKLEKLFTLLSYFSVEVRTLRGEPTKGIIMKDLLEQEPSAPYKSRDVKLPTMILPKIFIPGDKYNIIKFE